MDLTNESDLYKQVSSKVAKLILAYPKKDHIELLIPIWQEFAHSLLLVNGYECVRGKCFLTNSLQEQKEIMIGTVSDYDDFIKMIYETTSVATDIILQKQVKH